MATTYREHASADRYKYDWGLCSYENGFSQVDTEQDASYYGTWANPTKFIIFNYCEGDCTTTVCDDADDFVKEMLITKEWNEESGYWLGVDPGYDGAHRAEWERLGLGELLH